MKFALNVRTIARANNLTDERCADLLQDMLGTMGHVRLSLYHLHSLYPQHGMMMYVDPDRICVGSVTHYDDAYPMIEPTFDNGTFRINGTA